MSETYDLVVIGAGPAGYVAAIRAAQLGMKTAIVDDRFTDGKPSPGGTCLNIGCIPSKVLLSITEEYKRMAGGREDRGLFTEGVSFDLEKIMSHKDTVVRQLTGGITNLLKGNGIKFFPGRASLPAEGRVSIQNGDSREDIEAKKILLCTGSTSRELPFLKFNGRTIIDSTDALSLKKVPERLIILGAGAIGLEMASVWSRLGSEVTVLEIAPQILPGWDRSLAMGLMKEIKKQGITVHLNTAVERAQESETGVSLTAKGADDSPLSFEGDAVLVAAGRVPQITITGMGNQEFAVGEGGFLKVNPDFETSIPGIYAVGDLVPGPMLAHKAEEEGVAAVEKMAGLPGHINSANIPGVVYTHPEAAAIGATEESLKEEGRHYVKGNFPFAANGRALAMGEGAGFVKVLADADTDELLGVHILGANASELIGEATAVMELEGTAETMARMIHAHPTLSEAMKESALSSAGRSIHIRNRPVKK